MQQIINYIIDNWMWLFPIVLSVVEFIILLIFKKPNVVKFIEPIYDELIDWVNEAEDQFGAGQGKIKLDYVIAQFARNHPNFHISTIKYCIENILSTPMKKGGK